MPAKRRGQRRSIAGQLILVITLFLIPDGAAATPSPPLAGTPKSPTVRTGPIHELLTDPSLAPPKSTPLKESVTNESYGITRHTHGPYIIKPNEAFSIVMDCPSGKATGGGQYTTGLGETTLHNSYITNDGASWALLVNYKTASQTNVAIVAYLVCVSGLTNYTLTPRNATVGPGGFGSLWSYCPIPAPASVALSGGNWSDAYTNSRLTRTTVEYPGGPYIVPDVYGHNMQNLDSAPHTATTQVLCADLPPGLDAAFDNKPDVPANTIETMIVYCPQGKRLISGGVNGGRSATVLESHPVGEGWRVSVRTFPDQKGFFGAVVMCGA